LSRFVALLTMDSSGQQSLRGTFRPETTQRSTCTCFDSSCTSPTFCPFSRRHDITHHSTDEVNLTTRSQRGQAKQKCESNKCRTRKLSNSQIRRALLHCRTSPLGLDNRYEDDQAVPVSMSPARAAARTACVRLRAPSR
jgi:hypothetical protein